MTDVSTSVGAPYTRAAVREEGERVALAVATGADALGAGEHTVATVTVTADGPGTASITPVVESFPSGVLAAPNQPYDVTAESASLAVGDGEFAVDIVEAPDTETGETVEVVANVTNVGLTTDEQTVTLALDSAAPGATATTEVDLELAPGESVEQTLTVSTDPAEDSGLYDVTVTTANDTASAALEVYPPALDSSGDRPQDTTGDGRYNDVDGDSRFSIFDVQALFTDLSEASDYPAAFDFSGDGTVDIVDVQALFDDV